MLYGDGIHDDTLALQELLDKRGIVTVDERSWIWSNHIRSCW